MEMPSYEELFKQIKLNFWLIGIPYGNFQITWRYFVCLITLLLMIIVESAFLVSKITSVNLLEITQLVPCTCIGILSALKMLAITLKKRKIFELSESLGRLYKTIEIESEKGQIIRSQMILLKRLVQYYFILNAVLISVYNFSSPVIIFYNYWKSSEISFILPYQVLLPFEINSWILWGPVYTFSIASGIPYDNFQITWRYFVCLIALILMITSESAFLVSKITSVNLLEITQLVPCTCIGILSVLKIIAITSKKRKIFELSESLGRLYKTIEIESEKGQLIRSQMILLKRLVQYYFILNAVLISVYSFSTPVIIFYNYWKSSEISFILPYQVLLPFEINSWTLWGPVYTFSVATGFICVLYFTTIDVLYCVLTTHICANFIIISSKVQQLNRRNISLLKNIIKDHQYILRLSEDLEDIFTGPNLFNVLVGSIEICALGFNLAMGDLKQIPGCILFLTSVLLQILMMSVFGENIITESTMIGEAAYTCEWYDMDEKTKKIILTLMIRSKKPVKLTAYKFSVISYNSFCKILSTSWSYFTILRTIYTPPDPSQNY